MWKRNLNLSIMALGAILFVSGCKVKLPEIEVADGNKLSCTATVPTQIATQGVDADTAFSVSVTASGGEGPYHIFGQIGEFSSTTSVSKSYSNTSDSDIVVDDVVIVADTIGLTQQCAFSVTVHPEPVVPNPSITVEASPSAEVDFDETITLSVFTLDLEGNIQYGFNFTEPGISIQQNDEVAVFSVSDNSAHMFNVEVTATGDNGSVSYVATLKFNKDVVQPTNLNCSLSYSSGGFITGDDIAFTVTSSTGETLTITQANFGTNSTVVSNTDGVAIVNYSSPGTKGISVRAKDKNSNALCNNGSSMVALITVDSPPVVDPPPTGTISCTAVTDGNAYYRWRENNDFRYYDGFLYNTIIVNVTVSGSISGTARIKSSGGIGTLNATSRGHSYVLGDLSREVALYSTGSHRLVVSVIDSAGKEAQCTTNTVYTYSR